MSMYKETLGLIGGFGAYATLNFFRRILESFQSETERDYPHIIMDNNFTMPSRTRALLYDESYDEIVASIAESFKWMLAQNVSKIVLVCGTAHYFLKDVYNQLPEAQEKVVDLIDCLGEELKSKSINKALIIAAEGALLKNLYPERLSTYGVECISPESSHYGTIRYFIECVKKNKTDSNVRKEFLDFLDIFAVKDVILGCTEFPILVNGMTEKTFAGIGESTYRFYDPLEVALDKLKRIMN